MAKPLQPKNEAEVGKLRAKLNYAGFRGETAPSIFLGLKTICLILGFLAGYVVILFWAGLPPVRRFFLRHGGIVTRVVGVTFILFGMKSMADAGRSIASRA